MVCGEDDPSTRGTGLPLPDVVFAVVLDEDQGSGVSANPHTMATWGRWSLVEGGDAPAPLSKVGPFPKGSGRGPGPAVEAPATRHMVGDRDVWSRSTHPSTAGRAHDHGFILTNRP